MRTFAIVVLIIGLALGTIGGILQVITVAFGDSMMEAINANQSQLSGNLLQAQESLRRATDKSLPHMLYIVGNLAVTIAGGAFGLIAASSDTKKTWRVIFACGTIATGLGLLAFRSWIAAIAFLLAGFLLVILNEKLQEAKDNANES